MQAKILKGLLPQTYQHPLDSKALSVLQRTPGLDLLVRKFNEWGVERLLRVQFTGSGLRVTSDSFSEIHQVVCTAAERIALTRIPNVYILGSGEINAFTAGTERPIIVITSTAIDALNLSELTFVIGHELGHIKSEHVLYHTMGQMLPYVGNAIGKATFGIGALLSASLEMALLNWKRTSEFTADRAGLLACQDTEAAISVMMKFGGLPHKYYSSFNTEDFILQAREFEELDCDRLNWLAKALSAMGQTHPWTVMRGNQFLKWIDAGDYDQILRGTTTPASIECPTCSACQKPLLGTEAFCPGCGEQVLTHATTSTPTEVRSGSSVAVN